MGAPDISNLSSEELRDLEKQVVQALKQRQSAERAHAIQQINEIAARVGMTPEQLMSTQQGKGKGGSRAGVPVAAQFQHPSDSKITWSGRGREPRWITQWVESGKSKDELRIKMQA